MRAVVVRPHNSGWPIHWSSFYTLWFATRALTSTVHVVQYVGVGSNICILAGTQTTQKHHNGRIINT